MPGDQVQAAPGGERRPTTGPRHAAPRKSILGRLQMPAGKAIALAAMPSAVLMGMGLTPRLAQADEIPKNGFLPGPCVAAPDKPWDQDAKDTEEAKDEPTLKKADSSGDAKDAEGAKETGDAGSTGSRSATSDQDKAAAASGEKPAPGDSASAEQQDETGTEPQAGAEGDAPGEPTADDPSPDPSQSGEPQTSDGGTGESGGVDVIGAIGDGLQDIADGVEDLLTPDDQDADGTGQEPAPDDPSGTPDDPDEDAPGDTVSGSDQDAGSGAAEQPSGSADDQGAGEREDPSGAEDDPATGDQDAPAKPSQPPADEDGKDGAAGDGDKDGKGTADEAEPAPGEDGKVPFPCPEEKKVAGDNEQTPSVLPDKPFTLKTSFIALHGLDFKGVVNVRTANGSTKQVLKFTSSGMDIKDLRQLVDAGGGRTAHVEARKGSTSRFTDGPITLYTERLAGKLLGIIPIVFDPEHPPPVNLPEIFFTDATVTQAGQFGGTLTVPGLRQFTTGG